MHKSIIFNRVERAIIEDDYTGFCVSCGSEQDGCEPDERGYECESCGEHDVFGAEEILLMNF